MRVALWPVQASRLAACAAVLCALGCGQPDQLVFDRDGSGGATSQLVLDPIGSDGSAAGAGGTRDSGAAGGSSGGQSCTPDYVITDSLITDFEGEDSVTFESPTGLWQNWWPGHPVDEPLTSFGIEPVPVAEAGLASGLAVHEQGHGLGGQLGVRFFHCFDVTRARGLEFDVKLTTSPDQLLVRAETLSNMPEHAGGSCQDCVNNYTLVELEDGWNHVRLSFDEFGGGTYPLAVHELVGFAFSFYDCSGLGDWQIWIDNVYFML